MYITTITHTLQFRDNAHSAVPSIRCHPVNIRSGTSHSVSGRSRAALESKCCCNLLSLPLGIPSACLLVMVEVFDYGAVWDVMNKSFLNQARTEDPEMTTDKIVFGGPLTVDFTKEVGSLGEHVLNWLRRIDENKTAFVSFSVCVVATTRRSKVQLTSKCTETIL